MTRVDDGLQPVDTEKYPNPPLVPDLPEIPEDEETDEPEGPDDLSEFDQRHREAFTGLLFLGALSKTVDIAGHSFRLSTPTQRERLAAGLLHKPYVNTIAAGSAWATLNVAMYLDEVDGNPLPEPIGPSIQTAVQDRFNWVVDNIKDTLIDKIFEECLRLEEQVSESFTELERVAKS